jgi:hypothetical protein
MSMIFAHYDRTQNCDHVGCLGPLQKDNTQSCLRCGRSVLHEETKKPATPSTYDPTTPCDRSCSFNEDRPEGGKSR